MSDQHLANEDVAKIRESANDIRAAVKFLKWCLVTGRDPDLALDWLDNSAGALTALEVSK